mmetsp:Transcript_35180/g.56895  ORF Transcript_35180/g.56895 Transcript_35180/m.56895 type:complete len:94 (+) Transcript_35180:170-451(+)
MATDARHTLDTVDTYKTFVTNVKKRNLCSQNSAKEMANINKGAHMQNHEIFATYRWRSCLRMILNDVYTDSSAHSKTTVIAACSYYFLADFFR